MSFIFLMILFIVSEAIGLYISSKNFKIRCSHIANANEMKPKLLGVEVWSSLDLLKIYEFRHLVYLIFESFSTLIAAND